MDGDVGALVVYGAGGLGREVLVLARQTLGARGTELLGFIDDGVAAGTELDGAIVLGGAEWLEGVREPIGVAIAIADCGAKQRICERLARNPQLSFPRIAHPSCVVEQGSTVGEGTIMAFCDHVSIDVSIGSFVLLNGYVYVGHDTVIGSFSTVMPHSSISGRVTIGERCLIGAQSAILQGTAIGADATVGMGSVVIRDVPDGAKMVGNPARRI